MKGTSFLVRESPDADDERFLYLPALGRVRRIAGEEKQASFVGSDLTYEDVGGQEVADYSYTFANPNATWKAADGSTHPAWALEARAKDPGAEFPRSVSLVLKDRYIVVSAETFNRRNERAKIFEVRRLERVENVWTVLDIQVTTISAKTRTELVTTAIDYNVGLRPSDFDPRRLEAMK
jgi:hypothetical protein